MNVSLADAVDARLGRYLNLPQVCIPRAGHHRSDPHHTFEVFSQASQYIPPSSLNPQAHPEPRKQTKIPHFFPGWQPKFPNLPLDALLEIASHLHPLDLLNFSRTSKVFRFILLSRGSRSVWMNTLRSLPDFPPCPEDITEPAYVALVFDHHCFSCARSKAYCVDYVLRVRLCDECWGKYVGPGTDLLRNVPYFVSDVITMLVPAFDYDSSVVDEGKFWAHHLHPVSHVPQDLYYLPELEKMVRYCWPPPSPTNLEALRAALLERVEYIIQRHVHAVHLFWWSRLATSWMPTYAEEEARDWADVIKDIQERKYLLPYQPPVDVDEVIVKNKHYDPNIYVRAELIRTSGAMSHDQHFEEVKRRETFDNSVRGACLAARRAEFCDSYQHLVDNHAAASDFDRCTLPNRHDGGSVFDVLLWHNEGRVPVSRHAFYALVGGNVRGFLRPLVRHTMCELAAVVPYEWRILSGVMKDPDRAVLGTGAGAEDVVELTLARPDALFVCRECGARALPWPEIHGHWRERHPGVSFWKRKRVGMPGEQPRVRLWRDGREVVRAILDEAGLKRGLGRERLERLVRTGRLFCACGDPEMPLPGDLNWVEFVEHVRMHREAHRARCSTHNASALGCGDSPSWIHDSSLGPCITYLPKGADTSLAFNRSRADSATQAKIEAVLSACPEDWSIVCAVCKRLSESTDGNAAMLSIPNSVHAVAYHMETKHGRPFAEGDISFSRQTRRRTVRY